MFYRMVHHIIESKCRCSLRARVFASGVEKRVKFLVKHDKLAPRYIFRADEVRAAPGLARVARGHKGSRRVHGTAVNTADYPPRERDPS